jgi:hypothetical protein
MLEDIKGQFFKRLSLEGGFLSVSSVAASKHHTNQDIDTI